MKGLSESAKRLTGQPMFQVLARVQELQAQGREIIRFEIGDTYFGVDPNIIRATQKALDEGHVKYTNSQGILELREAICEHVKDTHGFRPSADQVIIMPANGVVDALMNCVVNVGEEVLIPDPGFPTYRAAANHLGVHVQTYVQHEGDDRFSIDQEEIESQVSDRTRLIISNSPNNPTGMAMTEAEANGMYEVAKKRDTYLLSDEVYSRLVFEGKHVSPSVHDECTERTIILNGFSKGYGMSGWRLGYAIGPVDVIRKMSLLFETIYSCVPPFIQHAGVAALQADRDGGALYRSLLSKSRDTMVSLLNTIPGVSCLVPPGAMYLFANVAGTGLSSQEFAMLALEKAGVALLPGTNFGVQGEGYVRLCFARDLDTIHTGIKRLINVFEGKLIHETVRLRR